MPTRPWTASWRTSSEIMRDEVRELARLGATYMQLDAPHYPLLIDPATRAFYESQGWSLERWLDRGIELDNAVIARRTRRHLRVPPVPRQPGQPLARLRRLRPDRRSAVPRRQRPAAAARVRRRAVGLIRAAAGGARRPDGGAGAGHDQVRRRETVEELERRTREAAAFIDLERLAISPQCGFATSVVGNALTQDDERAKLETIARASAVIWG